MNQPTNAGTELVIPPDAERAVSDELRAGLAAAGLPEQLIASHVPGFGLPEAALPDEFVRVLAAGGVERDAVTDRPTIAVECYGTDGAAAAHTASVARAVLNRAARAGSLGGIPCYGIRLATGTVNLPHPDVPDRIRYTFTISTDLRMAVA